ncbi:MAG: LytTR family transcriptional regulator DNA-binding domain-containing protein [Cyclobacteriaceae bacterium]
MSVVKVLIVDDEALAREVIKAFLKEDASVDVVGECDNGFEGLKAIQELSPDIVFLDVQMPKLTGFELLELLDRPPEIVFSTAYDEFAIKAFEQNAVDYLLKPYSKERFFVALGKAKDRVLSADKGKTDVSKLVSNQPTGENRLSRVVVKTGSKIHIIATEKIRYIEAMDDYVRLHTIEGNFLKQNTMKFYESQLPEADFVRVHRSYIVRVKEIARLEPMEKDSYVVLLHDGTQLSVSRSGYGRLKEALGF